MCIKYGKLWRKQKTILVNASNKVTLKGNVTFQ